MMKSDVEIKDFVYHKIKGAKLERAVTGKLSKRVDRINRTRRI